MSADAWHEVDEEVFAPMPPNWRGVVDEASANWALRKLERMRLDAENACAVAFEEAERLEEWAKARMARLKTDSEYLAGQLESWHRRRFEEDGRSTITLPAGVLSTRKGSKRVDIIDEDALVAWAQDNAPQLVVTPKPSAARSEIARLDVTEDGVFHVNGEVLPGCRQVVGERTFSWKAAEG